MKHLRTLFFVTAAVLFLAAASYFPFNLVEGPIAASIGAALAVFVTGSLAAWAIAHALNDLRQSPPSASSALDRFAAAQTGEPQRTAFA